MARSKARFSYADVGALVDEALEGNGTIIINRRGRKPVAIIPAEKLREMDTTDYLLSSPKNRERLLEALRDSRLGKPGLRLTIRQLRKLVGIDT